MSDPLVPVELGVILGCLAACAWWCSPAQRSRRRREQARARIELRRALRRHPAGRHLPASSEGQQR
ncbi:hypothetical protein [Gandjariella thermophila]|uniref:Uncharacterized protein n=1 Tax=Gandjariella thermophila TaxID=1931992 RepID=A0A4D4JE52_9PSEU|nr:hypothetical protein [Gandjariella thermophila]GDY33692.1 hypothetical protein GTS_53250 [Gandjariella thermophila]